jgi:ribonucleoside-triphosphate reductase
MEDEMQILSSELIRAPKLFSDLTNSVTSQKWLYEVTTHLKALNEKLELLILGTIQSTFTDFRYLRKIWRDQCEEERLLGVSLTGCADNLELLSEANLNELRETVVKTNEEWAARLGINPSTATTCVKPSGTVSQLVDSASGLHARHSAFYLRTIRADNKDPLTEFLKASGVYYEPDVMDKSENTTVFYFPIKAPDGAVTREEQGAIEALELWKKLQDNWCEHKPSATINVKEDEWMDVGAWVYRNFDTLSGVSFLPHDGGSYKQAPYQELTKEQYDEWLEAHPAVSFNWDDLRHYEHEDHTTASQELSCTGGLCEVVSVGRVVE